MAFIGYPVKSLTMYNMRWPMAKHIYTVVRDARTGQFVDPIQAVLRPSTTVTETVKR
jgi:hypothetical protein